MPSAAALLPCFACLLLSPSAANERDGSAMGPCTADDAAPGRRAKRARGAAEAAAGAAAAPDDAALRAMSAAEIEAYIAQAQRTAALPRAEVQRLRRVRRAIRNREYARLSRDKRSQYVSSVERELLAARDENRALRERLAALAARVADLERQLAAPPPPSSPPPPPAAPVAPVVPVAAAAAHVAAVSEGVAATEVPAPRQDSDGGGGAGTPQHQDHSPTTTAEVAATVPHGIGTTCLL